MNFKPTLWKSVVSLLVLVVLFISLTPTTVCILDSIGGCRDIGFSPTLKDIIISLITTFILYIIWSYFEKKK